MKKLILILTCVILIFCGCGNNTCEPTKFKVGDIVYSVVGNHQGQVIDVIPKCDTWKHDYYTVRFNIKVSKTNTKILSSDNYITSELLIIEYMQDYELKGVK